MLSFFGLVALGLLNVADEYYWDPILFWVLIGLWVVMPSFIVYDEWSERKTLRASEEETGQT